MKPYTILKFPNQKLKEIANKVEVFDDTLRQTIARMIMTMRRENGIGLAGNQIGILKQIIVIDTVKADKPNGFLGALINPMIIENSDETKVGQEGCLSFPNQAYYVQRKKYITVTFQNPMGQMQTKEFNGLTAVCIQHEIDHLNGITFETKAISGK